MKIAFLNKYQDKVNRGAETYVAEISKRLSGNYDVDVISNINYWNLFKKKYDFVIPTNGRSQVILVRLITWLNGGKMVVSGQSGKGLDDRINLYSFPNVFVPISGYALRWARAVNPSVKSVYIPNGVDLEKFNAKVRPIKIDLPKPIVLCVAAMVAEKRLDLLIKAVSETKASLLLVGKGNLQSELQRLGDEVLSGRFKVISLSHDDMPKVYPACDIFSYPTVPYESFGIVMVEAMASGLPVVATDDPIRREIIGDAGLYIDPTNAEKYAEALNKALEKKWGNIPRKQAEKFNWDEIAKKYDDLFKEMNNK